MTLVPERHLILSILLVASVCAPGFAQDVPLARPGGTPRQVVQADVSSNPDQRQLDRIVAMLEAALRQPQPQSAYEDLLQSDSLAYVIAAIGTAKPETAISLFDSLAQTYKGKNLEDARATTARGLARVLRGPHRDRFLKSCTKPEHRNAVTDCLLATTWESAAELTQFAKPIGLKGVEGLALLVAAGELKFKNRPWETIVELAASSAAPGSQPEELQVTRDVYDAFLKQDRDRVRKRFEALSARVSNDPSSAEAIVAIGWPLELIRMKEGRSESEHATAFARFICEASSAIESNLAAAILLGRVAESFPQGPPEFLSTRLKARWDHRLLDGPMSFPLATAAFHTFNTMLRKDPEWAASLAEKLVNWLLSQPNARGTYHMIGTIAGVMAGQNPEKAMEFAGRVRMLEWHANALRSIYREWAKANPAAAMKSVAGHALPMGEPHSSRLRNDLRLEASVGAAKTNPLLAAEQIAMLPDVRVRFEQGVCLIAPELARHDPARAINLLTPPPGTPLVADAAEALAWIALNSRGINIEPTIPDFHPDRVRPRNLWPGPRLSQPIRF